MSAAMRTETSSTKLNTELDGQIVVIKVGTSSLLRPEHGCLNLTNLAGLCEAVRDLKNEGYHVIIVSSGAVGVGCQRMGLTARPSALAQKQALAAVGQVHLMRYYDDLFGAMGLKCAQVLLTQDNLACRSQYLNAASTFTELLRYGAVPIVNENDTVAVEQLRFGDNDTLSAQVAALVHADWLFLTTDVPYLYTANPASDPDAQPIYEVPDLESLHVDTRVSGTQWGTGGMATKLTAARIATAAGCHMAICSALHPGNVAAILRGERAGTVFHALPCAVRGRKRWILSVPVRGELRLDGGATAALREKKKSLFPAGVRSVSGDFAAQDAVRLVADEDGAQIGVGLINYRREELDAIKGLPSAAIAEVLGYSGSEEVAHRDNIVLLVAQHTAGGGDRAQGNAPDVLARLALLRRRGPLTPGSPRGNCAAASPPAALRPGGDVDARLAALRQRAQQQAQGGGCSAGGDNTADWLARMRAAAEHERLQEAAAGHEGVEGKEGLDITADGWLP